MSKNNEDSIERFFQKAANQSDASHLNEDWQKMESMLDERMGAEAIIKKRMVRQGITVAAITAVIVAAISYMTFRTGSLQVGEGNRSDQEQAAVGDIAADDHKTSGNVSADLSSDPSPFDAGNDSQAKRIAEVPATTRVLSQQRLSPGALHAVVDASETVRSPDVHDVTRERIAYPVDPVDNEVDSGDANREQDEQKSVSGPDEPAEDQSQIVRTALQGDEEHTEDVPASRQESSAARWQVSVVAAPDFSATALSRYSAPGKAFGVTLGYRMGKKLSMTLGIVKSAKRYRGVGDEYHPPKGYWNRRTNGVVPDFIDGRCNVLEIPFSVQYDLHQGLKSRIYVSAGLSSYVMLDEFYDYEFSSPNPGADENWYTDENTRYALAAGNLAVGYERQLSGRMGVGFEPYVKMPFAGIGWSDVKLFSAGAYVSLRYTIGRRAIQQQPLNEPR